MARLPQPSSHVSAHTKDVWSLFNEAAANAEVRSGRRVVNLGQGFFSYAPPAFVVDAAKRALDTPLFNQYAPTRGRTDLLAALAEAYGPELGRSLDPATEVLVTAGANEGMYSAFTAFLDDGDEVVVFEPFFDQYISNIRLPGGVVRYVPLHPPADSSERTSSANRWYVDFAELEAAIGPRTKMLVINTPHNPIGKVFSEQELRRIGDLCVKNNIIVLSDEVYDHLYYNGFTRMAALSPELAQLTLTVGSAGKTFAATGWRVGWVIGPPHLVKYTAAANTRIVFSANNPLQYAVAEGFRCARECGYFKQNVKDFKRKLKILTDVFDQLGLPYSVPEGGYFLLVNCARVQLPDGYAFPDDISSRPRDFKLAYWLIQELGVVSIPPTEFTTRESAPMFENYLRFAFCKDDAMLVHASNRLRGLAKFIAA